MSLSNLDISTPTPVDEAHAFKAPGNGAVRCPCPFLNVLANHGYINRSGKYITAWSVTKGIMDCYNFDFKLALLLATAGIYTSAAVAWNPFWFHLDQLNWHSPISVEHDASLSRLDFADGDNHNANAKHIETLVSYASSPDGISPHDVAAFRVLLEKDVPVHDLPGPIGSALRCGEVGLVMGALGRGDFEILGRRIHSDWVRSFFGLGRLPDDWTRQQRTVTLTQVSDTTEDVKARMKAIRDAQKTK